MAKIIEDRSGVDRTVRIFDEFYNVDTVVSANQYDVVRGYFVTVCANETAANNLTASLFRISTVTGINVLDLLAEIKGTSNSLQMNAKICYYLNGIKSKTSLYGINVIPSPIQSTARNVVM
jgi:hypothetical protein